MTAAVTARPRPTRRLVLAGLATAGAGAAGAGIWLYRRRPHFDGAALDPVAAHDLAARGEILLVDIRRPDEWRRTGLPQGAVALDMRRADFIAALTDAAGADRDAPIALICAGGVRSARLGRRLTEAGFTNIIDVPEGMQGSGAGPGWLRRGLPTRTYEET